MSFSKLKSLNERDFFGRRPAASILELKRGIINALESDMVDRVLQFACKSIRRCAKLADVNSLYFFTLLLFVI